MSRMGFPKRGLTLIELLLVIAILVIALAAIFSSIMGQLALSEHARNMSFALNDANRIVEQIRQLNKNCSTPTNVPPNSNPPGGVASWDAWLRAPVTSVPAGGGGISLPAPLSERILMTCRNSASTDRCAGSQMGGQEWNAAGAPGTPVDPMQVTVSVCWRHRGRVIGECAWNAGTSSLDPSDTNGNNIIDSPVSLTTLVTCR